MTESEIKIEDFYKKIVNEDDIELPKLKGWQYLDQKTAGEEEYIAFSEGSRTVNFGEFRMQREACARALSDLGIWRKSDSRILFLSPNVTEAGVFNYGADMTGAVMDYVDPTSSVDKIMKYVETEKVTDIIGLDVLFLNGLSKEIKHLKSEYGVRNVIAFHNDYMMSLLPRGIRIVGSAMHILNKLNPNIIRYDDLLRQTRNSQILLDTTNGDVLDFITHTSGTTTGVGKPIPLTDHNRNSLVNEYALSGYRWNPGLKILHFIPYFAGYGTVNTVHLGLANGAELQQIPLFQPGLFGDYMVQYKPDVVISTTPCWLNMVNNPKYANIDLSNLVMAATGGSPTSAEDQAKINMFLASHGAKVKLVIGYGMSELAGCALTAIDGYNKEGSVGVPLPGVDLMFRDPKTGIILPRNAEKKYGEALISSNTMTSGTLDGKEVVKTVDIDGKKYIPTKDIMSQDETGFVYYKGRIDGMFQRYDGYNIYPLQIENLIRSLPGIKDVAIVGQMDSTRNGLAPKVYIELDSDNDTDKKMIIDQIINNYFIKCVPNNIYNANFRDMPHFWSFVENMPKNTMGKTDLHLLQTGNVNSEDYEVEVDEDNMSVKNYYINKLSRTR